MNAERLVLRLLDGSSADLDAFAAALAVRDLPLRGPRSWLLDRAGLLYTVFVWFLTLVFAPVGDMGAIYWVSAIVLGAVFTAFAVRLLQDPTPKRAMRLFSWSITYVTLLFGAMALDVLVRFGL